MYEMSVQTATIMSGVVLLVVFVLVDIYHGHRRARAEPIRSKQGGR